MFPNDGIYSVLSAEWRDMQCAGLDSNYRVPLTADLIKPVSNTLLLSAQLPICQNVVAAVF